jgi:hypothetical protein
MVASSFPATSLVAVEQIAGSPPRVSPSYVVRSGLRRLGMGKPEREPAPGAAISTVCAAHGRTVTSRDAPRRAARSVEMRAGAQPVRPTPATNAPIMIEIVALTAVACAAIQLLAATRRGSIRSGNRIVATTGTTTVQLAIAV